MEPIPETAEALEVLSAMGGDPGLRHDLVTLAERARAIAPDLVGVSISRLAESLTFTLVSSHLAAGSLDAVPYLDGGPCVTGVHRGEPTSSRADSVLDERRWQLFAAASAVASVRTTLTLPLRLGGGRTGTVNLYGSSLDAFDHRHAELAEVFGAWAGAAVTNADLSLSTVAEARATPARLHDQFVVSVATGLLAARRDLDVDTANERLYDAAIRADVPLTALAAMIIDLHSGAGSG